MKSAQQCRVVLYLAILYNMHDTVTIDIITITANDCNLASGKLDEYKRDWLIVQVFVHVVTAGRDRRDVRELRRAVA